MADIVVEITSGSIIVVDRNRGYSGVSGYSGRSGFSGANPGTSGVSGTSGKSGSSGRSGASGSSGASGTSGTSGRSGYSGISGTSGTSGTSGVSGSSGVSGTSGVSGVSGTSGKSGTSGVSGLVTGYTEGTWTPALAFGGASTGITYSVQLGWYTQLGDVLTAWFYIALSSKGSATGNATIGGLPVASAATANQITHEFANLTAATVTGSAYGAIAASASSISLAANNGGTSTPLADTAFANNSSLVMRVTYRTN